MKDLESKKPVVAIVGCPNAGKSTLMNRILGRRTAITEKTPGITRDIKRELAEWAGVEFLLLDTGGWSSQPEGLEVEVSKTVNLAAKESDILIFLTDVKSSMTPDDAEMAKLLSRLEKPVLLAVNKVDHSSHESGVWDFMKLGLGEPFAISALHGPGVADLLDAVVKEIGGSTEPENVNNEKGNLAEKASSQETNSQEEGEQEAEVFAVAIVGRPNVGKSTLFNQLVGEKRAIESEIAGTTRDPVDTLVETEVGTIRFVDTAGMRRKAKLSERVEYYAMLRALEAVDRADIALLVIDSKEGVTHQDQRLAERIEAAGCPILVLMNKWELCDKEEREDLSVQVGRRLHFLADSPLLKISALTGKGLNQILPALADAAMQYRKRVSTREVNNAIISAQAQHSPPKGAKVLYATQVASDPPTFTLFATKKLPATYLRYLERKLKEAFDFGATPVKLRVRLRK